MNHTATVTVSAAVLVTWACVAGDAAFCATSLQMLQMTFVCRIVVARTAVA